MRKLVTSIGPQIPLFLLKGNSEQGIEKKEREKGNVFKGSVTKQQAVHRSKSTKARGIKGN